MVAADVLNTLAITRRPKPLLNSAVKLHSKEPTAGDIDFLVAPKSLHLSEYKYLAYEYFEHQHSKQDGYSHFKNRNLARKLSPVAIAFLFT
jgi:hypothetical protein